MSHMDRELAALKEIGNAHLLARRFDAASGAYEEAAHLSELPRGGLCVKLARAHLAAGRPEAAAAWLMQVVDPAGELPHLGGGGGAARPLPGGDLAGRAPPPHRRPRRHLDHQRLRAAPAPRRRPARPRAHHPPARLRPVFQRHPRPRLGAPRHEPRRPDPRPRAPRTRGAPLQRHAGGRRRGRGGALVRRLVGGAPARGAGHPADGLRGAGHRPARPSRPRPRRHAAERHRPHQPRPRPQGRSPRTWASSTSRCSPAAWAPGTGSTTAAGTWRRCPSPRTACR